MKLHKPWGLDCAIYADQVHFIIIIVLFSSFSRATIIRKKRNKYVEKELLISKLTSNVVELLFSKAVATIEMINRLVFSDITEN